MSRQARIPVVDDEKTSRDIVSRALAKLGHEYVTAANGADDRECAGTGGPAGPAGRTLSAPPAFPDTGSGTALSCLCGGRQVGPGESAAGGDVHSRNTLLEPAACRGQVAALSEAVARALSTFGVERAHCGEDSAGELAATTRDLTAVVNSQGELGAEVVFGFDSSAARALADKISAFMFGETFTAPAGEEEEHVRIALGEMVSFSLLATLNALGLAPEFGALTFVKGRGVKLCPAPKAARSFSVTTEIGEFEVGFAPGR